ncbi:nucleosome remodeling factor [Pilobolus umbonatus]|nr:nucleosome remodeling factor [Pilobolus umbonatus]
MPDQEEEKRKKEIMDNYKQWKESAPMLYDMLITTNLTWPSLTCQWLPQQTKEDGCIHQGILIGTHTSDKEENYVEVMNLSVPETTTKPSVGQKQKSQTHIIKKMAHPGEVNRARYQPYHPHIIATKARDGNVLIYDRSVDVAGSQPILKLTGHTMEGYGLAWNPHYGKRHHILSAGFDNIVCHWDIGSSSDKDRELTPYQKYEAHTGCVEDVSWNSVNEFIFASVADDKKLMIWDTRDPSKPAQKVQAHDAEINAVDFHPVKEWMIATGSSDKSVGLFDMRKLNDQLYSIETHTGEVTHVTWNLEEEPILASAGTDCKIMVYDLRKIGTEQTPEDAEDGPPEVMFIHSGHTSRISDLSWNPINKWTIASVAEDNVLQLWQMTKDIYDNPAYLEASKASVE